MAAPLAGAGVLGLGLETTAYIALGGFVLAAIVASDDKGRVELVGDPWPIEIRNGRPDHFDDDGWSLDVSDIRDCLSGDVDGGCGGDGGE